MERSSGCCLRSTNSVRVLRSDIAIHALAAMIRTHHRNRGRLRRTFTVTRMHRRSADGIAVSTSARSGTKRSWCGDLLHLRRDPPGEKSIQQGR